MKNIPLARSSLRVNSSVPLRFQNPPTRSLSLSWPLGASLQRVDASLTWIVDPHCDSNRFADAPPSDQRAVSKQDTVVVFNFFDVLETSRARCAGKPGKSSDPSR